MNPADKLTRRRKLTLRQVIAAWCLAAGILAVIGWFDYVTGYEIHLFALYLIPVAFTAWRLNLISGVVMSFLCAAVWLGADLGAGHHYRTMLMACWNTGMELTGCLAMACAIAMLRRKIEIQKSLVSRLDIASAKIHRLRQNLLNEQAETIRLFGRTPTHVASAGRR